MTLIELEIENELELISFISAYTNGKVYNEIEIDQPEINEINSFDSFNSSRLNKNGKLYTYSAKGGIDKEQFTEGLLKRYEEERTKHEGLEKKHFIKTQIDFIEGIDNRLKKNYETILSSLKEHFEEEKNELTPRESSSIAPATLLQSQRQRALYCYYRMKAGNPNILIDNDIRKQKEWHNRVWKSTERTKRTGKNRSDLQKVILELERNGIDATLATNDLNQASSDTEE